jgi:hypothetical protein
MNKELQEFLNPAAARLNVLVAYENLVFGIEAMDLCDRLSQSLAPKCELQLTFWSLSALQLPLLSHLAEHEATEADLVIVSVNGGQAPPPPVLRWLRRWARRKHPHSGALAAQLHGILKMDEPSSPAFECLKRIADDSRVEFFSQVIEPTSDSLDESFEAIHKRAHMRSPVLDSILQLH